MGSITFPYLELSTIFQTIVPTGTVMDMKTIAEFVENDAIMEQLKELGVDYAQGYGIGKPKPFHDVINQFESNV